MQSPLLRRVVSGTLAALVASAATLGSTPQPASAAIWHNRAGFADDGFRISWSRTDDGAVRGGRGWYWGPNPWLDYAEFYRQGTNGLRTVQYFDKARMEVNNPNDRRYQNGVSNGLLVVELLSGNVQLGNDPFDVDYRSPADVPVAGNPLLENPSAPTYRSFAGVATVGGNGYRDPNRLGQRVDAALEKGGNISLRPDLASAETEIVQYNTATGHNISRVFWDFMNLEGPVLENDRASSGPVVDWLFAMGLPITDAYWTRARIGDAEQTVLVQLFERRVLTYTPTNPAGFQVEMGNVGQHYFQWRYPQLGQPWAAGEPTAPIVFASNRDTAGQHWELYTPSSPSKAFPCGTPCLIQLTTEQAESVAFSYRRSFQLNQTRLLIDSRRGDGQHRQLYEVDAPVLYSFNRGATPTTRRISYTDGQPIPSNAPYQGYLPNGAANDYNGSYSPDGTKIALVSDREGRPELYLTNETGSSPVKLLSNGCTAQVPAWLPDGRSLVWEQQCDGEPFTIMRGELAYGDDRQYGVSATLVNVAELTPNSSADNRFPRVAPDGQRVVFTSYRDGNAEIYSMLINGSEVRRLTNDPGEDEAATWSADGFSLAFASNRDGDYDIYTMNRDGGELQVITDDGKGAQRDDRWPLWAQ